MRIQWLGHACFLLTTESGVNIVTDPFDGSVGYPQPEIHADIVLISHQHFDHNCTSWLKGSFEEVKTAGKHEVKGVRIRGIKTYHDDKTGALRGENIVFVIETDGLKLCHMGDIGHLLSEETAQKIGHVDVLMIPVGGVFTVGPAAALEIIGQIAPNIIIPMHYKTEHLTLEIGPVHDFINAVGRDYDISRLRENHLDVRKGKLKKRTRIIVMEYM